MKKSRFTEEQIIGILKQHEAGMKTADLCREDTISPATFYGWKARYGGMDVSEAQRLRHMEDENRRLKQMVADLSLDREVLAAAVSARVFRVWSACTWMPPVLADSCCSMRRRSVSALRASVPTGSYLTLRSR